jgi:hypothetical protein
MTNEELVARIGVNCFLGGSLLAAVVLVGARELVTRAPLDGTVKGQPKFDAKSSWLSNTTLLGALLVSALKDGFSPKPETAWLGGLNLLFAVLAITAVLTALASERQTAEKEFETPVLLYLAYATVALWAAFGQLLTLAVVVWIANEKYLPPFPKLVFLVSIAAAAIGACCYAWKTMGQHLKPKNAALRSEWALM